jgi:endoglucanase
MYKSKFKFFTAIILSAVLVCSTGCGENSATGVITETMATAETNSTTTAENKSTAANATTSAANSAENTSTTAGAETVPASSAVTPETVAPQETTAVKTTSANSGTLAAPSNSGALQVIGTQLCSQDGSAVQLRGISTHGLAWFPDYVNSALFKELRENWNVNVIRLAMYTSEYGGYCTGGNQSDLKNLVKKGVQYATENDMYVIIDWHVLNDQNPNTYISEAKSFFAEMSGEYASYSNVLYEICNEPNGGTSWSDIKNYANEIIPIIKNNDADAVIIVGTPNWSQYVNQAAADPITGFGNIMYALHFYAATHKSDLRQTMTNAINQGLPVLVSEYGICDASGNGAIDEAEADAWVSTMDSLGVSYIAWNLSNKAETSAIISSSCSKTSGLTTDDLSASGKWLYEMLTGK